MILYHYRSIESALPEVENSTFRFASREELNDPMEGYLNIYWQGDRAAWEGLFRNYVCSVYQAIEFYLLRADIDMLQHNTLLTDMGRFDDVPLGGVLKKLGESFLADEEIQRLCSIYGDNGLKAEREELQMLLRLIHNKAMEACVQRNLKDGLVPEEEAQPILKHLSAGRARVPAYPYKQAEEAIKSGEWSDEYRQVSMKSMEEIWEDLTEQLYIKAGLEDEDFLYHHGDKKDSKFTEGKAESRQRRNWLSVMVDFPRNYMEQLIRMTYPESFVVCFSARNDNSAMWGNYADNHRGVCLVYDMGEEQAIRIGKASSLTQHKVKKVTYGGEPLERNFFESLGRFTMPQIKRWLTGIGGISSCCKVYSMETDVWREQYWKIFETKNYRKLTAWAHEEEYRIVIDNMFYEYSKPETRILKYDAAALKGVIFGINTSEYDKERIVKAVAGRGEMCEDFVFQQARFHYKKQIIEVRDKALWKLKRHG